MGVQYDNQQDAWLFNQMWMEFFGEESLPNSWGFSDGNETDSDRIWRLVSFPPFFCIFPERHPPENNHVEVFSMVKGQFFVKQRFRTWSMSCQDSFLPVGTYWHLLATLLEDFGAYLAFGSGETGGLFGLFAWCWELEMHGSGKCTGQWYSTPYLQKRTSGRTFSHPYHLLMHFTPAGFLTLRKSPQTA